MIYTIAHNSLEVDEKRPGAPVWQTREAAAADCPEDYAVYGVLVDWKDTEQSIKPGAAWRQLLNNAPIVILPIHEPL